MEIRKKADTGRTLDVRKVTIRTAGRSPNTAGRTYRTKRNFIYGNRAVDGVGQRNKKQSAVEIREKDLVKALTPEQRKHWNTYSVHEKEQILEQTGRRVKSRMRYEERREVQRPEEESVIPSDTYFSKTEETPAKRQVWRKRHRAVSRKDIPAGLRLKGTTHAAAHTAIPKEREGQVRDGNLQVMRKTVPSVKKTTASVQTAVIVPSNRRESTKRKLGTGGWKPAQRRIGIRKPEVQNASTHTPKSTKMWKKQAQQEKGKKKQDKKTEKLYIQTFVAFVEKDRKKTEQVRQQQKSGQITMTIEQLTSVQKGQIAQTAALPIRVKIAVMRAKVMEKAAKMIGAFAVQAAKYAAMLGLPILILYLLLQIIAGVLGGLAGDSDTIGSGLYSASGAAIAAYAEEWIDVTRYQMGAGRGSETDWQDVADCSSFVYGVYNHFSIPIGGVSWGGTTYSIEGQGTLVEKNSLEDAVAGDIILFFTPSFGSGNSVHVGIYAGNGMMVHNSSTAGHVIKTSYMSYSNYEVRRFVTDVEGGGSGTASGGHRADPGYSSYTQSQLETIWAVVAQEDNGSYEGALAVASCIMNRTESPSWKYLGSTGWQQMTANGQFCYSNDNYWTARLRGNVPSYVKQAVNDCFGNGVRNHSYTSFRSTNGSASNYTAVQIGGNWYFGN